MFKHTRTPFAKSQKGKVRRSERLQAIARKREWVNMPA